MTSELAASARPSRAGDCIDQRYRLEAEIGAGGLGSVYRATQTKLARPVAVKLLHESWGASEVQRGRFEREAKALAALEHPNIVSVLDYGLSDDQPYIVMELLEGETLAQRLKKGALPLETALSIARQLLAALSFMHDAGLVHRDLKPSNVFLQRAHAGERVKVLDFGLAKSTAPNPVSDDATLTRDGTVVGTPAYMSPEQATGDNVDARSDVYAVGVLLFQMLSGRLPFEGDAIEQVRSHLVAPVPALERAQPVRELDAALEKLIWCAMAKRREDRFNTAGEMLRELTSIIRKNAHNVRLDPDSEPESIPSELLEALDSSDLEEVLNDSPSRLRTLARRIVRWYTLGARVFAISSMLFMVGSLALFVMLLRSDDDRADLVALQQRVSARMAKRLREGDTPRAPRSLSPEADVQPAPTEAPPPPPAAGEATAAPAAAGAPSPAAVSGAAAGSAAPAPQPSAAGATSADSAALAAAGGEAATTKSPPDPRVPGPPPASNPWQKPLPKELRAAQRAIYAGGTGNDRLILALAAYSQAHADDPRAHLLLAQLYYNRLWRPDAVAQIAMALQIDLSVRGAPEVLKNLVAIVANGKAGAEASRLIVKAYGSEALPALDAEIAATQDPDAKGRLRYLRTRLQPAKRP